jgi:hypothetical protein
MLNLVFEPMLIRSVVFRCLDDVLAGFICRIVYCEVASPLVSNSMRILPQFGSHRKTETPSIHSQIRREPDEDDQTHHMTTHPPLLALLLPPLLSRPPIPSPPS